MMYQDLVDKKAKLAVIGLGYVGLPIAWNLQKKFLSLDLISIPSESK